MNFNPIMLAIPFFFLAMGIEIWLDRYRDTRLYRLNDSITNLGAGTSQQVVGIFLKVFTLGIMRPFMLISPFSRCRIRGGVGF